MTEQTNPLVPAEPRRKGGKATVDDLYACAASLNANPDVIRHGWRYGVVPNTEGKMCVRRER